MSPHDMALYVLVFTLAILGVALTARVERQREQLAELRKWADDVAEWLTPDRMCRECRCTDAEACLSGCWWVADDLCSSCADDHTSSLESGRA